MIRVKAALIHLGICLLIALVFSGLVFGIWYPAPLGRATNVFHIFWIILAVDVAIGPLITLIIYNPKKKELKWDLLIVALLQLSALFYGTYTVFKSRPAYLVFNVDRFDLIQAKELTDEKLAKASNPEYRSNPLFGPRVVAAVAPDDPKKRLQIIFNALQGGDDLPFLPEYYVDYETRLESIKPRIQPLLKLNRFNPDAKEKISALEKSYRDREVGFLPLKSPSEDITVIVDKKTAQVLEMVALKPWQ